MRLIDADAMRQDWLENGENEFVYDTNSVLSSIDEQATIDAVEVVRCRNCTHITPVEGGVPLCTMHDRACGDYEFCSYGERKTE